MKNIIIVFLLGLVLAGCEQNSSTKAKDGYYFEKETFTRTEFPIEVKLMQSEAEMRAAYREKSKNQSAQVDTKSLAAFAVIRRNDNKCTIYMLDPKVKYQPEYIGHEFVHCIYGEWHKEPQT